MIAHIFSTLYHSLTMVPTKLTEQKQITMEVGQIYVYLQTHPITVIVISYWSKELMNGIISHDNIRISA